MEFAAGHASDAGAAFWDGFDGSDAADVGELEGALSGSAVLDEGDFDFWFPVFSLDGEDLDRDFFVEFVSRTAGLGERSETQQE